MGIQYISQLFLSIFLGALIGLEREYKKREAGIQTYSLVTLGFCLFIMISSEVVKFFIKDSGNEIYC